ncbi:MAG: N-acetyltransferase family protein [Gammaproteobacteria bacterium]
MSGIGIRRAGLDDLDALVPLFEGYRRFYGQPGDLPRARGFLRERLACGESVVLLAGIAADGTGPAAGFAQLYPVFSSVRTARAWLLNDLFVATAARRRGVGRALLDAAAAFARADGAVALMLETGRGNDDARALYRSAGWHEDDTQWYSLDLASCPGNAPHKKLSS